MLSTLHFLHAIVLSTFHVCHGIVLSTLHVRHGIVLSTPQISPRLSAKHFSCSPRYSAKHSSCSQRYSAKHSPCSPTVKVLSTLYFSSFLSAQHSPNFTPMSSAKHGDFIIFTCFFDPATRYCFILQQARRLSVYISPSNEYTIFLLLVFS